MNSLDFEDLNLEDLRVFIIENTEFLTLYEGAGGRFSYPKFDLYARDYLLFAEKELEVYLSNEEPLRNNVHLINCITNLKRALDCELDTFLFVFNIKKIFQKRSLKFEKKLDFLESLEYLAHVR